jgi:hypothetical protein
MDLSKPMSTDGSHAKRRRKNSTLFEVWMNALSRLSEEQMQTLNSRKEILGLGIPPPGQDGKEIMKLCMEKDQLPQTLLFGIPARRVKGSHH